jgi:hypothetical protein
MKTEPEVHSTGRPRAEVLTALGKRAATAIRALARSTSAWVSKGTKLARLKRREQALRLKVYGRVQSIGRSVVFLHREGKSSPRADAPARERCSDGTRA